MDWLVEKLILALWSTLDRATQKSLVFDLCDEWNPEDLFDHYALEEWALSHGYTEEEAAEHANFWSRNS